jgi:hypothetical protein
VTQMTKAQHREALQAMNLTRHMSDYNAHQHGREGEASTSTGGASQGDTGTGTGTGKGRGTGRRVSSSSLMAASSMAPPPDSMKVLLNQLSATVASASFIAGNLLYELLFVNPLYRYSDAVTLSYIIFAALTFTSAVSAVVITNITLFLIGTLSHDEGLVFAQRLVDHGIELFVFSFTLSALVTWMIGAGLLPHATYLQSMNNRWPLTIVCLLSVVTILFSVDKAYRLVVSITKEMLSGGVEETEMVSKRKNKTREEGDLSGV